MMTPTIDRLRAEVEKRGTQAAVAKWLGCGKAHVGDMLKGRRTAGPRILKKLGLTKPKP